MGPELALDAISPSPQPMSTMRVGFSSATASNAASSGFRPCESERSTAFRFARRSSLAYSQRTSRGLSSFTG